MSDLVDITLPDGTAATVPQGDLAQALAAGATKAAPAAPAAPTEAPVLAPDDPRGGTLGAVAAGLMGAARSATGGLSDSIYAEAGNLIGGQQTRSDVLEALRTAKDAHPWGNTAGELGGLLAPGGYGAGLSAVGEGVEGAVAGRLGEGLLGRATSVASRGATEGGLFGAQNAINEANLGDTDLNGEKFFSEVGSGMLFGGATSLGLSALGKVGSVFRGRPGPMGAEVADAITGLDGGGKAIIEDAKATEAAIDAARASGATSEQAADMVDGAHAIARSAADAAGSEAEGIVGGIKNMYRDVVGARDAGVRDAVDGAYAERANRVIDHDANVANRALQMKDDGDAVFRNLGDTVDEVQFRQKPQQIAKLVDPTKLDVQADTVAKLLQDTDETLQFWESTASKGGAEGAIKSLRKLHTDAVRSLAGIGEGAGADVSRDLFVKVDNLKRSVDSFLQYGKKFGLPEALTHPEFGLQPLADKLRSSLEDSDVWGKAGAAQKAWNATFSENFARHQDFVGKFGQIIDRGRDGRPVTDLNAEKIAGQLRKFEDPAARFETVKSTKAFIDGSRARVAEIEKFGDLSEGQRAKLTAGKTALDKFEQSFLDAVKDADTAASLRRQQLREKGHSVGGIIGLLGDVITRPATTAARLGEVAHAINGVTKAIKGGVERIFEGKAAKVVTAAPRAPEVISKEIGDMRELAANPGRLDEEVSKMTGDLGKHAPQITSSVAATARRAVTFLANEAPVSVIPRGIIGAQRQKPRYSDQQIHEYETKRDAIADPKSVLVDVEHGRMNRDKIRAVEFVYPKLFAEMQSATRDRLEELDSKGKLDKMPYQQKALIATLLKVPADGTWEPDFVLMMQAAKAQPAPQSPPAPGAAPTGTSGRAIKLDSSVFGTEASRIEGGGHAA